LIKVRDKRLLPIFCEVGSVVGREREKLTVTEWANKYRWFAHGQSWKSQHGNAPYDIADAPFQRAPQDDLTNPEIQVHVWMMASRIAKTVMMGNGFGYFSEYDPATQLFMYPSQEDADLRSREEFQPLIDVSPALKGKYLDFKGGTGDNTISFKKFVGGSAAFVGSNAPSKLRARTCRVVWCDECDGYRASSGKEGDPILLAFNRSKNYEDPVRVVASTPTITNHSAIEAWYDKSDKNRWYVQCYKCGVWQIIEWRMYRWPEGEYHKTKLYCDSCDYAHNDDQRREIICAGEYRATAPFTGIRGYYLPGYYSIFPHPSAYSGKMHEMAQEVHNAKYSQNPAETVKVLANTFFCESYREESDVPPDWRALYNRREDYDRNSLPKGVTLVTAGTDFQADRIEIVFWGHGAKEEKWRIDKHVLAGDPRMPEMYATLEGLLLLSFHRVDGAVLKPKIVGCDTGYYACQKQLYEWIRPRQRLGWLAMKGASQVDADPISRAQKSRVTQVSLLMVGTHKIKSFIYNRSNIVTPGPGYIHFPKAMTESDFVQLFAEESKSVFRSGVQFKQFDLPSVGNRRNEELDCAVMAHAALYARGTTNYEYEEKRNLMTVGDSKEAKAAEVRKAHKAAARSQRSSLMRSLTGGGW